jgi:hypothetical protein
MIIANRILAGNLFMAVVAQLETCPVSPLLVELEFLREVVFERELEMDVLG